MRLRRNIRSLPLVSRKRDKGRTAAATKGYTVLTKQSNELKDQCTSIEIAIWNKKGA
jgi:hypothetical protein